MLSALHLLCHQTTNTGSDWSIYSNSHWTISRHYLWSPAPPPQVLQVLEIQSFSAKWFFSNKTWVPAWCDLIDAITSLTFGSKIKQKRKRWNSTKQANCSWIAPVHWGFGSLYKHPINFVCHMSRILDLTNLLNFCSKISIIQERKHRSTQNFSFSI